MNNKKLALIVSKGTLDAAYSPLILASTASALGYDTEIFFTFYGLQLLEKDLDLKVSPMANPGISSAMGLGDWLPSMVSAFPGFETIITSKMKKKMAEKGIASLEELRDLCQEENVKFIACQMTVDLFDLDTSTFINGVEFAGAARFFEFAGESDICLYI